MRRSLGSSRAALDAGERGHRLGAGRLEDEVAGGESEGQAYPGRATVDGHARHIRRRDEAHDDAS